MPCNGLQLQESATTASLCTVVKQSAQLPPNASNLDRIERDLAKLCSGIEGGDGIGSESSLRNGASELVLLLSVELL